MSALTNLEELRLANNQLTDIDVSTLTNLTRLELDANRLTRIGVGGLSDLTHLGLYNNRLASIDVNGLTSLTRLGLGANRLTEIDLRTLSSLDYLDLCYNRLTDRRELYDLENDPGERENLASRETGIADRLMEHLEGILERTGVAEKAGPRSKEKRERLEALGY